MNCVEYALALRSVANDLKAHSDAAISERSDRTQRVLHSLAPNQRARRDQSEDAVVVRAGWSWTEHFRINGRSDYPCFGRVQAKLTGILERRLRHAMHGRSTVECVTQPAKDFRPLGVMWCNAHLRSPAAYDNRRWKIEDREMGDRRGVPGKTDDVPPPPRVGQEPVPKFQTIPKICVSPNRTPENLHVTPSTKVRSQRRAGKSRQPQRNARIPRGCWQPLHLIFSL